MKSFSTGESSPQHEVIPVEPRCGPAWNCDQRPSSSSAGLRQRRERFADPRTDRRFAFEQNDGEPSSGNRQRQSRARRAPADNDNVSPQDRDSSGQSARASNRVDRILGIRYIAWEQEPTSSPHDARLSAMNIQVQSRSRFGWRPDSRARRSTGTARRRPILESLESRRLLASIAQYPVPSPGELPTSIITGPDGNLWFTEGLGSEIGMINPSTHVVTHFALPENFMLVSRMTVGPDGNIWFTDYLNDNGVSFGAIGSINPTTGAIAEYPEFFPGAVPFGITAGPDGNLWFTNINNNDIGIFNPTTDAVTILPVPGSWAQPESPQGLTATSGFSLFAENAIGMINPTTYAITTFSGATDQGSPDQIVVGPDGNLWYTEAYVEDIGTINPTTGSITQIPMPSDVGGITAGPDGDLWVTIGSGNSAEIGMLNPATLALTTFPVPISGYGVWKF